MKDCNYTKDQIEKGKEADRLSVIRLKEAIIQSDWNILKLGAYDLAQSEGKEVYHCNDHTKLFPDYESFKNHVSEYSENELKIMEERNVIAKKLDNNFFRKYSLPMMRLFNGDSPEDVKKLRDIHLGV